MRWVFFAMALPFLVPGVQAQDAADEDGRVVFTPPLGSIHSPVLFCRAEVAHGFPFVVDSPLAASTDHPIEASNLTRPDVQFALHYFEAPLFYGVHGRALSLREDESIPDDPRAPNVEVEVFRLAGGRREKVGARWTTPGRGLTPVDISRDPLRELPPVQYTAELGLQLWFPAEESVRIASVEEFLAKLERDPGPGVKPESRESLHKSLEQERTIMRDGPADERRMLLDYWDRGNEPGDYELDCKYRPRRSDPWQHELTAPPLRIRVIYEADPFELSYKSFTAPRKTPN